MSLYDVPKQLPEDIAADLPARIEYGALPWWARLRTPPPPGWSGAWAARLGSRIAPLPRRREAVGEE